MVDWIVFFQVSYSTYQKHRSKLGDLKSEKYGTPGYKELTKDFKTLEKYYRKKADVENSAMVWYAYLSLQSYVC